MTDPAKRDYGPTAASHRASLNDEERELFDWFTSVAIIGVTPEDAKYYSSMLQAVACRMPDIRYWEAVSLIRKITTYPGFSRLREAAEKQADITVNKPLDS